MVPRSADPMDDPVLARRGYRGPTEAASTSRDYTAVVDISPTRLGDTSMSREQIQHHREALQLQRDAPPRR